MTAVWLVLFAVWLMSAAIVAYDMREAYYLFRSCIGFALVLLPVVNTVIAVAILIREARSKR